MRQKLFLILLAGFSLTSCIGPKLAVCIVDINGFQCHDARTNKDFVVPVKDASDQNYVAMSPQDYAKLLDFIKNKCK